MKWAFISSGNDLAPGFLYKAITWIAEAIYDFTSHSFCKIISFMHAPNIRF